MYYSQEGQDRILDTEIFKEYHNGTFVDVGAHNGVLISNTFFFEKERGWSGLLIEPISEIFQELQKNRPDAILENCAVSETDGMVDFLNVTGYSEMTSGIVSNYDPRHRARIDGEVEEHGGTKTVIQVRSYPLSTLLEKHDIHHIHYLSIDVEGSEMSVIRSIDFSKVFIDVIGFENNYDDNSAPIIQYLQERGYSRFPSPCVDIFMIHSSSQFAQNTESSHRA